VSQWNRKGKVPFGVALDLQGERDKRITDGLEQVADKLGKTQIGGRGNWGSKKWLDCHSGETLQTR
jgi:hypothetical protein